MWFVNDTAANLDTVLTGIAASRNAPAQIDYFLFDEARIAALHIVVGNTPGDTPFEPAKQYHRDLTQLTALQALRLVREVARAPAAQRIRISGARVTALLRAALAAGTLAEEALDSGLREILRQ